MLLRSRFPILAVLPALLLAGACSPDDEGEWDEGDPARIVSFKMSPTTVRPGDTATLSWATELVSSVEILDRDGTSVELVDAAPESGKVKVQLGEKVRYTLVAISAKTGDALKRTLDPERPHIEPPTGVPPGTTPGGTTPGGTPPVTPPVTTGGARIDWFIAQPTTINPGGVARLTWTTTKAARIRIVSNWGDLIIEDTKLLSGSIQVKPTRTTRYVLTVFDEGGSTADWELEVRVVG